MNEKDLTPHEHAELRGRLIAGAKRIHPVGKHRNAIVAGTLSVVLVAALSVTAVTASNFLRSAPEPVSTPTPSSSSSPTPTPTPTNTPTPTSTPTATADPTPVVAFDGDCNAMFTQDQILEFTSSEQATLYDPPLTIEPTNLNESIALLGGLSCRWYSEPAGAFAAVSIYPEDVVPASVWESSQAFDCDFDAECARAITIDGVWVYAGVSREMSAEYPVSDGERMRVEARVDGMLAALSAQGSALTARAGTAVGSAPLCSAFAPAVPLSVGMQDPTVGYPFDNAPRGVDWEVLQSRGLVDWCGWYDNNAEGTGQAVRFTLEAEAGAPSPELLAGAEFVDINGVDLAWYARSTYETALVVVVGDARVAIHSANTDGSQLTDIARAVASVLRG